MSTTPRTWRLFEIPKEGLYVHLDGGWQDEAIDGNITITTPHGVVLHDKPGANYNFGIQPEGVYIFRADPENVKRQVQIKNRW